jgi:hypothetical protein
MPANLRFMSLALAGLLLALAVAAGGATRICATASSRSVLLAQPDQSDMTKARDSRDVEAF